MRTDTLITLLAVLLASASPTSAWAQSAWRVSHTGGQPLLLTFTPPLQPGQTYWFETGGASLADDLPAGGDTVVTLLTGLAPSSVSLAGADGCAPRARIRGSCFSYTVPLSYTSPVSFPLLVRPYQTVTSGTTWVRVQQASGAVNLNTMCPSSTMQPGCWVNIDSDVSFGGAVRGIGSSSSSYHLETRERPGSRTTYQLMAFAPSSFDWNIKLGPSSIGPNHTNLVGGTTELLGGLPSGVTSGWWVFAGSLLEASTLDLVRNDFGRLPSGVTFGTDTDGDGLGASLESALQTCDGATSTYCSGLRGCTSPGSELCIASRRDSDQDGFEDALEFYGYQNGIDNLSNLARFGADPAQYDVFLEADVATQRDDDPTVGCVYDDDNYLDWFEANQIAQMYAAPNSVAGGVVNPNGAVGIAVHVDIAPPPDDALMGLPANDSPRYGVWGGATCVVTPACTSDADCTFGGVPGTCAPSLPGVRRHCSALNTLAAYQTPQRRWLFRNGLQIDSIPEAPGTGQGGRTAGLYHFYAGGSAAAAHELGHLGTLQHASAAPNTYTEMNFNPVFTSTMNYRYSYVGFIEIMESRLTPPPPGEVSSMLSYMLPLAFSSEANFVDPLAMSESCAFTSAVGAGIHASNTLGFPMQPAGTCWNVDWDRDGTYLPPGQTTTGAAGVWSGADSRTRRAVTGGVRWMQTHAAAEIVVTGPVTRLVRNELSSPASGGNGQLTVSTATTFGCPVAAQAPPADRFPPCDFAPMASAPLFDSAGAAVRARAFAASDIATPSGGSDTMLLVWRAPGTATLRWGTMAPGVPWSVLDASGTVAGATPRTTTDGTELLSLARTATGAILVYRNPSGALVEQPLSWSGSTAVWGAPVALSSGIWSGMNGSAGLTHVYGTSNIAAGVYMAVHAGASDLRIYRRTGAAAWTLMSTSSTPAAIVGQPTIEIGLSRPRAGGSYERLHVFGRFADASMVVVRDSDLSSVTFANPTTSGWGALSGGERTLASVAVARDTQQAPYGVRGVDYALVGNATVLGLQAPGVMLTSCPAGHTPVWAGSRQVCFFNGVPADGAGNVAVIDCGVPTDQNPRPTNGGCPSGYACQTFANVGSFCTLNGFAPMVERRAPAVDGVIPGRIERHNEWSQMLHGYCVTGRALRAESFTPTAYRYPPSGLPSVTASATCRQAPTW